MSRIAGRQGWSAVEVTGAVDFVRGDATRLSIPAHGDALRAAGAVWLTGAFRKFGALPATNRVVQITHWQRCPGGSTGQKFFLSVAYEFADPDLLTDLFVKFSRDFDDPIRDNRGKYEMESEVRLAALSRLPAFPINVPRVYFADYDHESKTGLLITQQITFGERGIEPHRIKCLDHEQPSLLLHYKTIIEALAQIAAAHRSGRLGDSVDEQFPYDGKIAAAENSIAYSSAQLRALVAQYAEFAARCPQLLPAGVASAAFIEKFDREAALFLEHETAIRQFLHSDSRMVALCHWNAQIDNAWFWRDPNGTLRCGLLDWGHVNQMNLAFPLWGCLSGALPDIWEHHLDELLVLFTGECRRHGGPVIDVGELKIHLFLYIAIMGLSYFMESPARILSRLPEAVGATGPRDPMFRANDTARSNVQILGLFMNLWRTHEFGRVLEDVLAR